MLKSITPDCDIRVTLRTGEEMGGGMRRFLPGESVEGEVTVRTLKDVKCNHLWVRFAWHTEGRGDRDRSVVHEQDVYQGTLRAGEPMAFPFQFLAPRDPWSFAGVYINIVWAIEVDVDVPWAVNPRYEHALVLAPAWAR
jgi:Sporulation control protein